MLRLRRLIRLLLDAIGNNVNMGRHCVFLTWCLFLCRRDAGEGDAVWSAASSGKQGNNIETPEALMLSGLRLRRGLVLGRRDSAKTVFQKSELAA